MCMSSESSSRLISSASSWSVSFRLHFQDAISFSPVSTSITPPHLKTYLFYKFFPSYTNGTHQIAVVDCWTSLLSVCIACICNIAHMDHMVQIRPLDRPELFSSAWPSCLLSGLTCSSNLFLGPAWLVDFSAQPGPLLLNLHQLHFKILTFSKTKSS